MKRLFKLLMIHFIVDDLIDSHDLIKQIKWKSSTTLITQQN